MNSTPLVCCSPPFLLLLLLLLLLEAVIVIVIVVVVIVCYLFVVGSCFKFVVLTTRKLDFSGFWDQLSFLASCFVFNPLTSTTSPPSLGWKSSGLVEKIVCLSWSWSCINSVYLQLDIRSEFFSFLFLQFIHQAEEEFWKPAKFLTKGFWSFANPPSTRSAKRSAMAQDPNNASQTKRLPNTHRAKEWVFGNRFICDALFGSCAMVLRLADRVHCPSLGSRWGILLYVPQLLEVLSALYAVFELDMPSFSKAFKGMRTFFFDGRGILGEREILWFNIFYK